MARDVAPTITRNITHSVWYKTAQPSRTTHLLLLLLHYTGCCGLSTSIKSNKKKNRLSARKAHKSPIYTHEEIFSSFNYFFIYFLQNKKWHTKLSLSSRALILKSVLHYKDKWRTIISLSTKEIKRRKMNMKEQNDDKWGYTKVGWCLLVVGIAIVPGRVQQQAVQVLLGDPQLATTTTTSIITVLSRRWLCLLVEKLHALLRWACPRGRECRTSCEYHRRVVVTTIAQEIVQIVRLAGGQIVDASR